MNACGVILWPATPVPPVLGTLAVWSGGLAVGLFLALVAVGVCAAIIFQLNRRLALLKRGAQRLAKGDLSQRLPVMGPPEVAGLAEAINRMAEQLAERLRAAVHQRNELEAVLASMVEGVLAVDSEEHLLSLNRAAANLLEIDLSQALGRVIQEVVRNAPLHEFVAKALVSTGPVLGEIVVRRPAEPASGGGPAGNGQRVLQVQGTALRDGLGRRMGAVIVLHDVSELRRLEAIRRDFVANVSHEIRTPVSAIRAAAETLFDLDPQEAAQAHQFLQIVIRQADRLQALMDDLLNLARIEQDAQRGSVRLEHCLVLELIESALETCQLRAQSRNVRLECVCPPGLTVPVSPGLVEQALVNLLDNAIKYSPAQGVVRVGVETHADEAIISVADQGPGIAHEHQARIFERFYRVDKARSRALGGTGLGLAIVKHVAQAHGGRVSVESTPGAGSTFKMHLPGVETENAPAPEGYAGPSSG